MKNRTIALVLTVIALLLVSQASYATTGGKDKNQKPSTQTAISTEAEFSYVIKGFPQKILFTSDGTEVTCMGISHICMQLDWNNGVAIVDPDACSMGPTYIGCQQRDAQFWTILSQTPNYSTWELYGNQQPQMTTQLVTASTETKCKKDKKF
jgi:hypothetical protein